MWAGVSGWIMLNKWAAQIFYPCWFIRLTVCMIFMLFYCYYQRFPCNLVVRPVLGRHNKKWIFMRIHIWISHIFIFSVLREGQALNLTLHDMNGVFWCNSKPDSCSALAENHTRTTINVTCVEVWPQFDFSSWFAMDSSQMCRHILCQCQEKSCATIRVCYDV